MSVPKEEISMVYAYTIFDANPNSSSGTAWPSHEDVHIEADSDEEAVDAVRDVMGVEAAGLSADDGYDVGQLLYAIVWDADAIIVGEPTYEITSDDLGVVLRVDADTDHEDVEGWYDSLGWHVNWDAEHDGGQVAHPVCTVEQLRTLTDAEILAAECPDGASEEERYAYESAIAYARTALDAAESVVGSLESAVEAYKSADSDAVIAALREASQAEKEYGDDPAATKLAESLLIGGRDAMVQS